MLYLTPGLSKLVKSAILLFMVAASLWANAQSPELTLERANELAAQNYPLVRQKDLLRQSADITIENLQKGFLPQFSLAGQATYQSDVTKIDIPFPQFKFDPPAKDQYKVVADVSQLVYDGGATREQKKLQLLNADVEEQRIEVELYQVKERINRLYLDILYLDEQLKQIDLIRQDIQTGLKRVNAQVRNGIAFKSNSSVLKAELLKTGQRAIELKASKRGMTDVLSLFLNQPLDSSTVFERPQAIPAESNEIRRPEIKLFNDQTRLLSHQSKIIKARNQPKASLFVQGGYGRPALNLLKNEFDPFYIGGIRFNWNLGGLYTYRREMQLVDINRKNVDVQKDIFLLNTNIQLRQQQSEISKLQQLIASDNDIINLRKDITTAAKAQLENGVITANDYLREINAEDQARQTLIAHELQLLEAQITYQTIKGKP